MRILTPFWFLHTFDRYLPEMKSIARKAKEFHLTYIEGEPEQQWKKYFRFHRINVPYMFIRSKFALFFFCRRNFYNMVKNLDVDVIYNIGGLWEQEFSRYCSKKMGVPYVVRLRADPKMLRNTSGDNPIKKKIANYLDIRSLSQANLVIPISIALAKKLEDWGVKKEKIAAPVYNGVDVHMFRPMNVKRSREFTVAYAGRISREKRIPWLLRIAERLREIRFIIAGHKEMDVNFPSSVEYVGALPFSEMPEFYNKADLVVLPSVTEGFPGVVLEAYACGKPALVAKEAFPEELKVFGSVAGIDEFESEINRLKNSNLRAIGRGARSYVKEHFVWDKFGDSIVDLLKNVIE